MATRNLPVGAISKLGAGCPKATPKIWVASKTTASNDKKGECIAALHDCDSPPWCRLIVQPSLYIIRQPWEWWPGSRMGDNNTVSMRRHMLNPSTAAFGMTRTVRNIRYPAAFGGK